MMHGLQLLALHAIDAGQHVHHRFTGPHVDYVAVGLGAAASWVGITGPGEAALIAAGISAAHGHVDIVSMIGVAWFGAMCGGTVGWLIGLKGGRALMTRPGTLYRTRLRLLRHGDRVYERRGWLAVYLAPSWMAGISGMHSRRFLPANAVASLVWAAGIGLGSYLAGHSIAGAIGAVSLLGLVALIVTLLVPALMRNRRRARDRA